MPEVQVEEDTTSAPSQAAMSHEQGARPRRFVAMAVALGALCHRTQCAGHVKEPTEYQGAFRVPLNSHPLKLEEDVVGTRKYALVGKSTSQMCHRTCSRDGSHLRCVRGNDIDRRVNLEEISLTPTLKTCVHETRTVHKSNFTELSRTLRSNAKS